MSDALFQHYRDSLKGDLGALLSDEIAYYENGDFQAIFRLPLVKLLLGHEQNDSTHNPSAQRFPDWNDFIFDRLGTLLAQRKEGAAADKHSNPAFWQHLFFLVALAALQAFVQSNVTGPPLPFPSADVIFSRDQAQDSKRLRSKLIASLGVDGEAAYKLTPNVELFCLADSIITSPAIQKNVAGARWLKLRIHFLHQRLLSEVSSTLQSQIYEGLDYLASEILAGSSNAFSPEARVEFLLERAAIHMHHGFDKRAREDLDEAAKERHFEFVLTGRLGKRTKYQQRDASQLVVLARSAQDAKNGAGKTEGVASEGQPPTNGAVKEASTAKPENLVLNDDTLLERISFAENTESSTDIHDESPLPSSLSSLDPANQPMLQPLDSIILLSLASSITNTSPQDSLTREESLPYATRVLEGGSSNWQVYTQALLVRSRIEGHKSRTTERGLLQLQALVDQIIADTTSASNDAGATETAATSTFLPQPKESESAPVMERLRYVYQLCSPTRWELEAELASRWVSLGGVRSALEIYERLEMWAEAALCWAAVEREDKATKIVRRQLFNPTSEPPLVDDQESWKGAPRDPPPPDAPRLYCILGDITHDISYYETAWTLSHGRYVRAQRSLGRHYFATGDFAKAANAYGKALKVNQLNRSSWFALGCALLELAQFERAVEAFSRTVQLDDTDAEAWSNLAAALLRLDPVLPPPSADASNQTTENESDEEDAITPQKPQRDAQQHKKDALNALKRAASLNYDNFRIWDNLLTVAASISPPSYTDIIAAQTRIIEIRGPALGEKCIDVDILERLVRDVISSSSPSPSTARQQRPDSTHPTNVPKPRGLPNLLLHLFDTHITPLITSSHRLWNLVANLELKYRNRPAAALHAIEKGWRAVLGQSGWENGTEERWEEIVGATVELVDAYERLGGRVREGLGRNWVGGGRKKEGEGECVREGQSEGMSSREGDGAVVRERALQEGEEVPVGKGKRKEDLPLVAKDWKFKARSAIRGVLGRGKGSWEGSPGWERLKERLEALKG